MKNMPQVFSLVFAILLHLCSHESAAVHARRQQMLRREGAVEAQRSPREVDDERAKKDVEPGIDIFVDDQQEVDPSSTSSALQLQERARPALSLDLAALRPRADDAQDQQQPAAQQEQHDDVEDDSNSSDSDSAEDHEYEQSGHPHDDTEVILAHAQQLHDIDDRELEAAETGSGHFHQLQQEVAHQNPNDQADNPIIEEVGRPLNTEDVEVEHRTEEVDNQKAEVVAVDEHKLKEHHDQQDQDENVDEVVVEQDEDSSSQEPQHQTNDDEFWYEDQTCAAADQLRLQESELRARVDPLTFQLRELSHILDRAERVAKQNVAETKAWKEHDPDFQQAHRDAVNARDCLLWLIDRAESSIVAASRSNADRAHTLKGKAMEKRDEIWGLQKRYRAVFHALATPHFHRDMPRTQKTAESLETKLDRGAFKSGMEEYQALHNLQEEEIIGHNNKFGDDSTDKNRLSSSTTPNEKSMLDLVDETESWLDKQEHVASQIHEEYRGMRDDWEAAYKQLPQEVEASATSKDYAKETLEGASALEKLRRVVPGIIHNTKKKLMQIFEST